MAFTFAALRAGLATRLATVTDLNVYSTLPGQVQPPAALLVTGEPYWDRDQAMGRGMAYVNFDIGLLTSLSNTNQAQVDLDALVDDVVSALLADKTLGGACDDLAVPDVSGFDEVELGGVALLASRVAVQIIVDET